MFILLDFLADIWGLLRKLFIWIDSIGLTFIDDSYNLMINAANAFDGTKVAEIASSISKNCYIIIGIFALFKVAIILVNAIINPEKLTEKKTGFGNVLINLVITVSLFIVVPFLFDLSRQVQEQVVGGNYISKVLIGVNLVPEKGSSKSPSDISGNPGKTIKDIAVRSLIKPDSALIKANEFTDTGGYLHNEKCGTECQYAISAYNNDVSIKTLTAYIGTFEKVDGETVYVYNYIPFVTLVVGLFITWVLLSFAIDIGVRSVELVALEILSPLFIVTYIDPKSSSNGPFKKWVSACAKTYVNLFIKIVIVCLMLLFISKMDALFDINQSKGLLKLLMIISILIFAKKAPKWLGDMIGVSDAGLGGLGIGKKLGGMALAGGLASKGLESAKKFGAQKGKNFLGNRVRNTAARVGAMKEAHKANKISKKNPNSGLEKQSLWKAGRAAAKNSRAENWGQNSEGVLKDLGKGYMAGRMNINPDAKSLNEKFKEKSKLSAKGYNEKIGNTQEAIQKRKELAENLAEAKKLYKNNVPLGADGDRLKVKGPNGENVYVNPRGDKEINQAIGNATTELGAFEQIGTNMVNGSMGKISLNGSGQVIDTSGKVIANSAADYALQNMDLKGKLAIKSVVASNVEKDIHAYENSLQQINVASKNYTDAMGALNDATQKLSVNSDYQNAQNTILKTESLVKQRDDVNNTILKIKGNSDYQFLSNQEYSKLTPEEQNRLASYNTQYKEAVTNSNNLLTEINKEKQNYTNAISVKNQIENQTGITEFREKCKESKKQLDAWKSNAEEYENKFKTTEVYKIDDDGKISGSKENPYEVKIDGKTYNPADPNSMIKFQEIKDIISTKASKAKNKYDKSMEDKK